MNVGDLRNDMSICVTFAAVVFFHITSPKDEVEGVK